MGRGKSQRSVAASRGLKARLTFATISRLQGLRRGRRIAVEKQAKRFFVSGRVQGVGFRFFAEREASRLGLGGYVRNLYDGRVEVYAVGTAEQLDRLTAVLRRGPAMAEVHRVAEEQAPILPGYEDLFTIERDD